MNDPDGRALVLSGSLLVIIILIGAFMTCLCSCSTHFAKDLIDIIEVEQKFERDMENAT